MILVDNNFYIKASVAYNAMILVDNNFYIKASVAYNAMILVNTSHYFSDIYFDTISML